MDKEKFGIYLSNLRNERGLTQLQLANKLHVTDKAVSRWERGIGLPDINSIEPLANALGVSLAEIMRAGEVKEVNVMDEAVKNTITLAKIEKRRTIKKGCSLLMIYIALKFSYEILIKHTPSSYNNLPMVVVYILLLIYIIFTILFTIKVFKKGT